MSVQKNNPVKGDWVELLKKDFSDLEIAMDEDLIKSESKTIYKNRLKKHMKSYMFKELKNQQQGHNKINQICYNSLETQKYLKIHMLNNHKVFLLFSLRSRNAKQFKANFPYNIDQTCPMVGCNDSDTQEHCLQCAKLWSPSNTVNNHIQYHDIFSEDLTKQVAVTKLFVSLLEKREDASAHTTGPTCCPVSTEEGGCSDQCLVI